MDFGGPAKTRRALKGMGHELGEAIKRLLDTEDCRLVDVRTRGGLVAKDRIIVPIETRAIHALDISLHLNLKEVSNLIFARLTEHVLAESNRSALDLLLEQITKKRIQPPPEFISAVREILLNNIDGLDEFESVMDFASHFPSCISKDELYALRLDFELRFERMVETILDRDSDPDQLREYANVLEELGNRFGVDVSIEYDSLRDQANEIEGSYSEEDHGDYESWKSASTELVQKEDEIHSMFDGLRGDA